MTLESSNRIALGLALPFAVTAVPPIIAKEKRRTRHRKVPASVERHTTGNGSIKPQSARLNPESRARNLTTTGRLSTINHGRK